MQSLLGGADCSTSSNPLKQVLQKEGVDNSIFRDRLGPSSGPSAQAAFRPAPAAAAGQLVGASKSVPHPFNLSHLSAALASSSSQRSSPVPPDFNTAWAISQRPAAPAFQAPQQNGHSAWQILNQAGQVSAWASDFQPPDLKGKARAPPPPPNETLSYQPQYPQYGRMPFQSSLQPIYAGQNYIPQNPVAGQRGQREHEEMEAAFGRALADAQAQERDQSPVHGEAQSHSPTEEEREAKGEFDKVWESLRPEAERLGKLAEWERDFSQFTNDEDDLFDTLNDSLNREDLGAGGLEEGLQDMPDFASVIEPDNGLPRPRAYEFADPNPHLRLSPVEAWVQANHLLNTGASLSEVTLLLESFLRQATSADYATVKASDVEAWSLLGRTHAMNEKEEKALEAFEEGRKILSSSSLDGDIDSGRTKAAGEMLTNLAISYVNESLDLAALTTLHQFLKILHPAHAGLAPSRTRGQESPSPWALHSQMRDNYLELAKSQYAADGKVDPDVQVGLGTLYYMMGEYDEARGCWVAALGERPSDYLLWNRLGATLANSGNPEEAVDAYRRALELRPTFTRAIFNLGVACLNIGVYREAAEHFLAALSLHPNDGGEGIYESGSIWNTLRRALVSLDLPQLATKAVPGTDLETFRQAGFEF